jgi:hypothetical protein
MYEVRLTGCASLRQRILESYRCAVETPLVASPEATYNALSLLASLFK